MRECECVRKAAESLSGTETHGKLSHVSRLKVPVKSKLSMCSEFTPQKMCF